MEDFVVLTTSGVSPWAWAVLVGSCILIALAVGFFSDDTLYGGIALMVSLFVGGFSFMLWGLSTDNPPTEQTAVDVSGSAEGLTSAAEAQYGLTLDEEAAVLLLEGVEADTLAEYVPGVAPERFGSAEVEYGGATMLVTLALQDEEWVLLNDTDPQVLDSNGWR